MEKICVVQIEQECRNNIYFTTKILNFFRLNGYQITSDEEEADVIIVTGCGVFNENEELAMAEYEDLRETFPEKKTIPAGCFAKILELKGRINPKGVSKLDEWFSHRISTNDVPAGEIVEGWPFYHLQICQGCVGRCSYCAIKKAKGFVTSRPIENIIDEAKQLTKDGFNHFILLADDAASYGVDIGTDFAELANALVGILPSVAYLPHYLEPGKLLDLYPKINSLFWQRVYQINVPVQSVADRILKLMNRNYSVQEVGEVVLKIKEQMLPETSWIFRGTVTHVIYGFPTETEAEFVQLFKTTKYFDEVFFHRFSPRPGTPAAKLPMLPERVIQEREEILWEMALDDDKIGHNL